MSRISESDTSGVYNLFSHQIYLVQLGTCLHFLSDILPFWSSTEAGIPFHVWKFKVYVVKNTPSPIHFSIIFLQQRFFIIYLSAFIVIIKILTDHKNLKHWQDKAGSETLLGFNYKNASCNIWCAILIILYFQL